MMLSHEAIVRRYSRRTSLRWLYFLEALPLYDKVDNDKENLP